MQEPVYFRDFSKGVISNLPPTKLVDSASPRAFNTAFRAIEGGQMGLTRRPGYREIAKGSTDDTTLVAQAFFEYTEDGTTTRHHIGVASDGTLWELSGSGSTQLVPPVSAVEFASAVIAGVSAGVAFIQAKNMLLGWPRGTGATPFKIYRRTGLSTLYVGTIGLPRPDAPTFDSSIAGDTDGDIDYRVTWYNSHTGTESSPSETFSHTASMDAVTLGLPTNPPGEVNKIRLYVRKGTLQTKFYRSAAMEVAAGTPTIVVDLTDIEFTQLTLTGPTNDNANNPPPEGILCAAWHLSRAFISDGGHVFYSQVGNPEQFDPISDEPINPGDGQLIQGLLTVADDTLGVWKERSVHAIRGQTPASWDIDVLIPTSGTISGRSLVEGDGLLGWWSELGPVVWDKQGPPTLLVHETLMPLVKAGSLLLNRRDQALGAFDAIGHRFLFTLDRTDSSPWTVAPWSTKFRVWEAIAWDLGAVSSLIQGPSTAAEPRVFFGGLKSVSYELSMRLARDAATEGSLLAYGLVESGTGSEIVLAQMSAPTVNPRGSVARVIDPVTLQVHRSTYTLVDMTLTWDEAADWVPPVGAPVIFDSGVVEWDSVDTVVGTPSNAKRVLQSYGELWTDGDTPIFIGMYRNNERTPLRSWDTTISANDKTAAAFVGPSISSTSRSHKRWAGYLCQWTRMSFVGWYPLTSWMLTLLGFTVVTHDDED
jgi:hypothetical protein